MALTDQLAASGPYLERLLDDDYVHENLIDVAWRGRDVYTRVSQRSAPQAANDQRLHRSLRAGAASMREAILAVQGKRSRPRRRRRLLVLAMVAVAGGVTAAVV